MLWIDLEVWPEKVKLGSAMKTFCENVQYDGINILTLKKSVVHGDTRWTFYVNNQLVEKRLLTCKILHGDVYGTEDTDLTW